MACAACGKLNSMEERDVCVVLRCFIASHVFDEFCACTEWVDTITLCSKEWLCWNCTIVDGERCQHWSHYQGTIHSKCVLELTIHGWLQCEVVNIHQDHLQPVRMREWDIEAGMDGLGILTQYTKMSCLECVSIVMPLCHLVWWITAHEENWNATTIKTNFPWFHEIRL